MSVLLPLNPILCECVCVCTHVPGPYKQRLAAGCSLIRLQKWVCSLSPLSPACLPLPLCLSLSLPFWLQRAEACVIQASSSGTRTDHLSSACLYSFSFLSISSIPRQEQSCSWSTLPAGGWEACDALSPDLLFLICC